MTPTLAEVLAAVTLGRVAYLTLTPDQKQSLRDPEARLALDVLRHFVGAREASVSGRPPAPFPLTEPTFQAVGRKLGHAIGIKRSRSLLRRLVAAEVLERSGSYRQPYRKLGSSGYRVTLYRLRGVVAPPLRKRPVGRVAPVKDSVRRRWWAHRLFGTPDGRPPPNLTRAQRRRMRSHDELEWEARKPRLAQRGRPANQGVGSSATRAAKPTILRLPL